MKARECQEGAAVRTLHLTWRRAASYLTLAVTPGNRGVHRIPD